MNHGLSSRGIASANNSMQPNAPFLQEAIANPYDAEHNPEGTLLLQTAENKLNWHLLQAKLERLAQNNPIPDWVANYASIQGVASFRESLATFLSTYLAHCPVDPSLLAVSTGACAVIELTAWCLGEPGDVVVIPAPAYATYDHFMHSIAGLERYDLFLPKYTSAMEPSLVLNSELLEETRKNLNQEGKRFRMLVLTQPDNPTGRIYSKENLKDVAEWCMLNQVHLIVNEIYGLSMIDTQHPELQEDYGEMPIFQSFVKLIEVYQSDYLHFWYSLSKDLGASGFRVGCVYSHNQAFIQAFNKQNVTHLVSNHTQWIFQLLLEDHTFLSTYFQQNRQALTASYLFVIQHLRKLRIPYVPASGGLFVWIDLSEFLDEQTEEADCKLWEEIYRHAALVFTPGQGFGHPEKGKFRLVFSCVQPEVLEEAMKRFTAFISAKRGK